MSKFLLGRKIGMSQFWDKENKVEAITLIDCSNLFVLRKKTLAKDKYEALILSLTKKTEEKEKMDEKFFKLNKNFSLIKEFRVDLNDLKADDYKDKNPVSVQVFNEGEKVKVSAKSKGKGFQGVVKRHNFAGGPKTHGHRHVLRSGGSIGCAFPEHVNKGKKMAGRMGDERVSVKNIRVAWVDESKSLIALTGAIPGRKGSFVEISSI